MKSHAAVYAARRQLGLDDDTARDVYEQVTGKRSLRAMTERERQAVVSALRAKGFRRAAPSATDPASKYRPILRALWIAGWNLGVVRDRSDRAMESWILQSAGVDHPKWIWKTDNAHKAIEGLKAWLAREGCVDWHVRPFDPPCPDTPGYRIATAQWLKLGNASTREFWDTVAEIIGHELDFETEPTAEQWIDVMNRLGERIRAS